MKTLISVQARTDDGFQMGYAATTSLDVIRGTLRSAADEWIDRLAEEGAFSSDGSATRRLIVELRV